MSVSGPDPWFTGNAWTWDQGQLRAKEELEEILKLAERLLRDGTVLPPEDAVAILVPLFRLLFQLDQLVPSGNGASVASHCAFLKFKSEMNINVCNVIVIVVS